MKKAERAGEDKEAAARAVLLKPVKLKLPKSDEIKAAWRRTVPAPPLSVPPAAPPSAQPPSPPPPAPNAEPIPEPEPELSDRACVIIAISRSEEASEAINYAFWVMNERHFGEDSQGGEEMTLIDYKHALHELQEVHPLAGEFFSEFNAEEPMRIVEWAVRCEAMGYRAGPV